EGFAAVFAMVFQAQVGEQGTHLVVVEAFQWLVAPEGGETAEQVQAQRRGIDSIHDDYPGLAARALANGAGPVDTVCWPCRSRFRARGALSAMTAPPFCHRCRAAAIPVPTARSDIHGSVGASFMQLVFARQGGRPCR